MLQAVTDKTEIQSIKDQLTVIRDLCIEQAKQAAERGNRLDMSGYMEDANSITRVIKTLRAAQ
jgi:hypothetical protein